MCLFTKQICPIKARKDIVCYKAFTLEGCVLVTPYQRTKAYLREPMIGLPLEKMSGEPCPNNPAYRQKIYEGYVHAFVDRLTLTSYILVKCIIPKGTLYYKGVKGISNGSYPQEICAKTMILKEIVQ